MSGSLPSVSVVIPARAADSTLPRTLASVLAQDYPHVVDIVVAAAESSASQIPGVLVVSNPAGTTPAGLNAAITSSTGEIIVRCDAHAVLPPGYITRAVETLQRTGADSVGGMQVPVGTGFWERAIAASMSSPFGAGDARYRIGGVEGPVETVYLGVFRREILQRLGGYDEAFLRNQDYELNHRIIASGGVVWFDPELAVEYRPRGSLVDLARQYFAYGRWKRAMARKHPGSLRPRQLAPPVLVVALAASLVAAPFFTWSLLLPAAYVTGLVFAAVTTIPRSGGAAVGVPAALATMHLSWGLGFWRSQIAHRLSTLDGVKPSRR